MSNKGLPAMGFFVQRMGEIMNAELNKNYYLMFRYLLSVSDIFNKVDREKCEEPRKQIEQYIEKIESKNGRNYNHTLQIRNDVATYLYNNGGKDAKIRIYDIMWEGGYIDKVQFGSFYDPSKGRKSGKGI